MDKQKEEEMSKILFLMLLIISTNINSQDHETKKWSKYDFVPGENVIFVDDLSAEKPNEFPSRWNLLGGSAEIGILEGENVISFAKKFTSIAPHMNSKSYLPAAFTLEMDLYFYKKGNEAFTIDFGKAGELDVRLVKLTFGKFTGETEGSSSEAGWHRLAIAYNEGAMKIYFDENRILNIPQVNTAPESFTIESLSHGSSKGEPNFIKNIRLAEGSFDLYNRITTDGKFTARGILFDAGSANLKPESMGELNRIFDVMSSNPELKFIVEGHTDSDGNEESNMDLSKRRAASVTEMLVSMGINKSRLSATGKGETEPADSNETSEGKANNRRVVFVKN